MTKKEIIEDLDDFIKGLKNHSSDIVLSSIVIERLDRIKDQLKKDIEEEELEEEEEEWTQFEQSGYQ